MRVKPPGDGPPSIPRVDPLDATAPPAPADEVAAVGAPAPVGAARGADAIGEVARRLKAGEITAADAVALLIDEVVERQTGPLPGDHRAIADELKAILRAQLESDPYLASRVRRLGNNS